MRVECRYNREDALGGPPPPLRAGSDGRYDLTVGREYAAFGLAVEAGVVEYLVHGDSLGLMRFPAGLFIILDPTLENGWVAVMHESFLDGGGDLLLVTYSRFAEDPLALERLFDGDEQERRILRELTSGE